MPLHAQASIERRTRQLGREMFDRMSAAKPTPLNSSWWQERMMQLLMQDEQLKVQAFRFIDVLPALSDDVEIARHLREYFAAGDQPNGRGKTRSWPLRPVADAALASDPPDAADAIDGRSGGAAPLSQVVASLMAFRRLDGVAARVFSTAARRSASWMAGSFIAAESIDDAVRVIRRMRNQQLAFTIDVLGEAAVSGAEAAAYHRTYMQLVQELPRHAAAWPASPLADQGDGRAIPRVNVSVKLTSLFPGFDPIAWDASKARAKDLLRPILRAAMQAGVHLHVDMEHHAIKDLTLDVCEELFIEPEFRDYPHVGIVLQAYLRDGDADAARTIAYARRRGTPLWVRLVKGAYWDSETMWAAQRRWPTPVYSQKWQSDACYERMTRALCEHWRHTHLACASHNVRSLCHAIAARDAFGVPSFAFELQALFGMGDPIKRAAVEMQQRCRVYTPYGDMLAGMAYLIRRLLENTANESFLRQSGAAEADIASLLRDPMATGRLACGGADGVDFELFARTNSGPLAASPPPAIRYELGEPIMEPFENAASTDFAIAGNRQSLRAALSVEQSRLGRETPMQIGGRRCSTGVWIDTRNPSRPAEVIARAAKAGAGDVDAAVAAAGAALPGWRATPAAARAASLTRLADALERRRFELSAIQILEAAKTWREADADVSEAIDYCRFYAREMSRIAAHTRRRDIDGETNELDYAARGVTAVLGPANFPLSLIANMTAAALVTGNPVVLKPAPTAAAVAARFVDACGDAEFPPGVLNLVFGDDAAGEALVRHADVAAIAFTGTRAAGVRVNTLAAEHPHRAGLKRVVLDLSGKNAIIVDVDADLDEAIKCTLASAFSYAGQKCSSLSRLILLDGVHDRFLERFVDAARSKPVGPAEDPATAIPPLLSQDAYDAVRRAIDIARSEARCALAVDTQALVDASGGWFVGPHVFVDTPPSARVAREEILGPVVAVLRARSFEHAVELFNDCDYGLTGGVFSRSPSRIEHARRECVCGNFYINRGITGSRVDLQPFGGLKLSGGGPKSGGPEYLLQYCTSRTVTENTIRRGFAPSEETVEALA